MSESVTYGDLRLVTGADFTAADAGSLAELRTQSTKATSHRRGWLMRRILLGFDLIAITAALAAAVSVPGGSAQLSPVLCFAALPAWVIAAKLAGLYERDVEWADYSTTEELTAVLNLLTAGAWFAMLGYLAAGSNPPVTRVAVGWAVAIPLVAAGRAAARGLGRSSIPYRQNTLIVGAGDVGQLVARKLLQHPEYGIDVVGFIDTQPRPRRRELGHLMLLGGPDRLNDLVEELDVERVIVAFSSERDAESVKIVRAVSRLDRDVQVDLVPRLFELVGPKAFVHNVEGLPLIGVPPVRLPRSSRALKRTLDVVLASVGLALAGPLFLVAAVLIKRDSEGPVFFRQERLGREMHPFDVLKFRTMRVDTDQAEHRAYIERTMTADATPRDNGLYKLDRSASVTRVGRWLRKTSLDELPQLINVLRGDMSLVGPRPCLAYETELFEPHHFERFLVPAGLTGLWQVTARAKATFREALEMDVMYARGWSLRLDLQLLLRTPLQLLHPGGTA